MLEVSSTSWRNPQYNAIRFVVTIGIAILFGIIFWGEGDNLKQQQDLRNLLGAMYAAIFFLGATNTCTVQPIVAIERTVFYREKAAGMYSALPYAFAQVAIETIYVMIQTFLYSLILYTMIGFPLSATKFLFLWFYYFVFMSDFLVPVAMGHVVHVGWVLMFLFVFVYGIKFLNFQRR
ncbi:ABC transporter G family member 34-like [Impatiens glandulifera]|uniref:ABC transporter G family member 34-like n=1 Tax=Impatiens glandulifera TaxID=253017 RepID=UPI001FB0C073|nr:ABC transporter G family member 34-like [Impatiens glandulifera]